MPNYHQKPSRILWGPTLTQALDIGYPLDAPLAYDVMREGSETVQYASGLEDSWILGWDSLLEGDVRWIPTSRQASPVHAGWDDTDGWRAFLRWARAKNTFSFFPDARNLVQSPKLLNDANADTVVDDFFYNASASITAVASVDGAQSAQKLAVSASVAGAYRFVEVRQRVYGVQPGDIFWLSVEAMVGSLTGDGRGTIGIVWRDAGDTTTLGQTFPLTFTNGAFARLLTSSLVAPAGTGQAQVCLRFESPAGGGAGNVWFRNAVLARNATDAAAFIDNPEYTCYLAGPMEGGGDLEDDMTRKLRLALRTADGQAWSGY